jgi:hypothetical protein
MKDWIRKEIDPPGMEKKRRGSLYSLIGRVFGIVKRDAEKSFHAFFPYSSDSKTLKKHGAALSVPNLPYDTEEEYRDRVTAASFYLMRSGERAYILDQLRAHFEDRFTVKEHFLYVQVKIFNITGQDRSWAQSFLDGILDPNIRLDLAESFDITGAFPKPDDPVEITVRPEVRDSFIRPINCNGRIKADGYTANTYIWVRNRFDGATKCDGIYKCDGLKKAAPRYAVRPPFKCSAKIVDEADMVLRFGDPDETLAGVKPSDAFYAGIRFRHKCDGIYKCDATMKCNSGILQDLAA